MDMELFVRALSVLTWTGSTLCPRPSVVFGDEPHYRMKLMQLPQSATLGVVSDRMAHVECVCVCVCVCACVRHDVRALSREFVVLTAMFWFESFKHHRSPGGERQGQTEAHDDLPRKEKDKSDKNRNR